MKDPLNACLKDRYTLIEQSDLNTLIEQSQYSSEEQCSKLIDKEIWLVMGSYCHCQQVVTFFFFFFFFGLHLTTWVKGPTLTLCPGTLNFSGRPCQHWLEYDTEAKSYERLLTPICCHTYRVNRLWEEAKNRWVNRTSNLLKFERNRAKSQED